MSARYKWSEIRRPGNPALEQGFTTTINTSMWLAQLRRQAGLTQGQVAERLNVSQSWVSQIEGETDVRLSTVSAYVAALGGRLQLAAAMPDGHSVDLTLPPREEPVAAAN